eukprot:4574266-Prymnesium_polylepis.1
MGREAPNRHRAAHRPPCSGLPHRHALHSAKPSPHLRHALFTKPLRVSSPAVAPTRSAPPNASEHSRPLSLRFAPTLSQQQGSQCRAPLGHRSVAARQAQPGRLLLPHPVA